MLQEGLKISNGEIICLLDADDYFLEDKIESLNKIFSKNREINVVFDKPKKLIKEKFSDFPFKKKTFKIYLANYLSYKLYKFKKKFF